MRTFLLSLASILVIGATFAQKNSTEVQVSQEPAAMLQIKTSPGIDMNHIDRSVRPQDDFYRFVNGKWLSSASIPDDRTRWGSFDELRKKTDDDALLILRKAAKGGLYEKGTDQWKAIQVFNGVMDIEKRNAAGIAPLKPYIKSILRVTDINDLNKLITSMEGAGGVGFFGSYVYTDLKNSSMNTAYLGAGALGLP